MTTTIYREGSRSIPAHAGEPPGRRGVHRTRRVYPRPRGGTARSPIPVAAAGGLSPPTRGNPQPGFVGLPTQGSIPAHAGEPLWIGYERPARGVYPRPRGGTCIGLWVGSGGNGLSPPTRGNRLLRRVVGRFFGSIPAHAGEPWALVRPCYYLEVYPRPRGGTPPAPRCYQTLGVYPRPRGGTLPFAIISPLGCGLSPPTRGNLPVHVLDAVAARSIPAHAGEPLSRAKCIAWTTVYPRPRGGTP